MIEKTKIITVNQIPKEFSSSIIIGMATDKYVKFLDDAIIIDTFKETKLSHRDEFHLFIFLEKGNLTLEIDFQRFKIKPFSVTYIHPNQIHRIISLTDVKTSFLAIENENISSEQLQLLEDIAPAQPLMLKNDTSSFVAETISLCLTISKRKDEKLYLKLLKESCNLLVSTVVSQYLGETKSLENFSRFEIITKAFKANLERNFITFKRPTEYAQKLNISTPYLNECVKKATGHPVSYHIQQRIILEAKRLLYHTNKSIKEISIELGYDDYPYFSRLFTKAVGMTALNFRKKNLD